MTRKKRATLDGSYLGYAPVTPKMFDLAMRLIETAKIEEMVAEFREADRSIHPGGRPLTIQPHAAVTILVILMLEDARHCHVTKAAELIVHRLTPEQLQALGVTPATAGERSDSTAAQKRWRDRMHRSLDSMFRTIDPYWNPNRRIAWLKEEWAAYKNGLPSASVEEKTARLYRLNNALVRASTHELPTKYRHLFTGERAVDGTSYKVSARGKAKRRRVDSVEPNGGWYGRDGDHKPSADNKTTPKFFGYEATLFCWTKAKTDDPFDYPFLVDAMGYNPPGLAPSAVTVRAARTLFDNGAPIGPLRADKQYWAGQNIDEFHKPMWQMGFEAVTQYREPNLGLQGQPVHGAILVDGDYYCHSMGEKPNLINATRDYIKGDIDRDQLRERINARADYLFKDKQKPVPGGPQVKSCPAVRGAVSCPLKPDFADRHPLALPLFNVSSAGSVCDNMYSTTFEEPSKFNQKHQFMTDGWFDAFGQRNVVESYNKDYKETAVGTRNGTRLRGFAANFFVAALCVVAVNIKRINGFLRDKENEKNNRPPRRHRRPRHKVAAPYTDDYNDQIEPLILLPDTNREAPDKTRDDSVRLDPTALNPAAPDPATGKPPPRE